MPAARVTVRPNVNGSVDFILLDGSDDTWAQMCQMARDLYPGWVELDWGTEGDAEYVCFGPKEMIANEDD